MSRKKHDTAPVTAAAALAHDLLGEEKDKPVSETRADWVEVLTDTPAPDSRHIFSPAVGNLVCERIADGETLNQIASEPGMPSRSTIDRWCTDRPEFKRQYDIAVQLRADGLLEETIEIIDDKKEIVTETTTEDEDGTKRVSKAFTSPRAAGSPLRAMCRESGATRATAWASLRRRQAAAQRRRCPEHGTWPCSISTRSKNRSWRGSASPMRRSKKKHEARHRSDLKSSGRRRSTPRSRGPRSKSAPRPCPWADARRSGQRGPSWQSDRMITKFDSLLPVTPTLTMSAMLGRPSTSGIIPTRTSQRR